MKESKRAGVSPRRPVEGLLPRFQSRGGLPPLLSSPMWNTKKMAGSKGRRIGPMRRTAKHGVRSPNAACTKKHSENEIWCIEPEAAVPNDKHRSPNPKTVRPKMKTNPDHEERGLETHRLRCCCACAEKEPSKTRAKEQTQREEQGQETTTNFAGVLEAERLLELATSSSRARPEQGRARKGQVRGMWTKGKGRE